MKHRLAMLLLAGAAVGLGGANAEKDLDIQQIMQRVNKPTGLYFNLKKDLEDDDPMWADMRADARELAQLVAALPKQTPRKGDKASWMKKTRDYAENAKALYQAVSKKDKKAVRAAIARMGGATCTNCHKVHRPK
jgi:cytochrome c556